MKQLLLLVIFFMGAETIGKPKYTNRETEEVINKMILAHGGYETWKQISTLTFTS